MSFEALALAAVRDILGETVTVDPDGIALAVKAIARRPDAEQDSYDTRLRAPVVTLEILAADIAAADYEIAAGTVIEMADGARRVVKTDPAYLDSQRLVLVIDTRAEAV